MSALITPGADGLPGIDLPTEYRSLQDWSNTLDDRLKNLKAILRQLKAWTAEVVDDDPLMVEFIGILAEAGAVEGEALSDAFTVADAGFDVLYALADAHGIDPDDLDDLG
jgi:hypothetical protein